MAEPKKGKRKLLGEFLVESGLVTEEQIQKALEEQKKAGERIGRTLIELGFLTEKNLIVALGKQLGLPHIDLASYSMRPEIVKLVPENIARRYELIALDKVGSTLTIAMVDPLNVFAIDEIQKITRCRVEPIVCSRSALTEAIDQYYRGIQPGKEEETEVIAPPEEKASLERVEEGAEVIDLVNALIETAVKQRATDIHIEPEEDLLRVRYRVDGFLHEAKTLSKDSMPAIVSRIKVLSGLDISERRVPQDGRFRTEVDGKEVDLRISTLPTVLGEKVAMRLLDRSLMLIDLKKLGFQTKTLDRFDEIIKKPYGMILATGPTSSGKTTTLYAALHTINSIDRNITTIEDPVEYQLRLVNQVEINPKAGLTFARGLRAFLRQDPNVIMVGEIRDLETAEIAVQAALTGHVVFSTVHTNNAPSTLTRLVDMKLEPFLISASVIGVLSQRLVRLLCPNCKEPYNPSPELIEDFGLPSTEKTYTFYKAKGCGDCRGTGYQGRTAIFELMTINDQIRELIMVRASTAAIGEAARKAGMQTLREDGMQKVAKGITTVEEVVRTTIEER